MTNEDDLTELMDLFDNPPEPKHKKRKPVVCSICGLKSDDLEPRTVGKSRMFLCSFCRGILDAPRNIIRGGSDD